jgi:membrane protein implicated in regulation of membrane protease activity
LGRIFSNHHHAGAVAGGAVGFIVPHQNVFSLGVALVIALVPLTLAAALWPSYRIAPLTAVIVLLTPGAQQLGPVGSAFYRIVQITLGSPCSRAVGAAPALRSCTMIS